MYSISESVTANHTIRQSKQAAQSEAASVQWHPPRNVTPEVPKRSALNRGAGVFNQLAASTTATVGSAIIRGIHPLNPINLAINTVPYVPEVIAHVMPHQTRLINAARAGASYLQNAGWAYSIGAAAVSGNPVLTLSLIGLYGTQKFCRQATQEGVKQFCEPMSPEKREWVEPWVQAAGDLAVSGVIAGVEAATRQNSEPPARMTQPMNHETHGNGTFTDSSSHTNNKPTCTPSVCHDQPHDSTIDQQTVLISGVTTPANQTLTASSLHEGHNHTTVDGNDFYMLPVAHAGLIHSFTPQQMQTRLQTAAENHAVLPKQCPDMAHATLINSDQQPLLYLSGSSDSGWVSLPGEGHPVFHYQLFVADQHSPIVTHATDDNFVPSAQTLHQAQACLNGSHPTQASESLSADCTVQLTPHLDPNAISHTVKNGALMVMKPCNLHTGETEAPVLLLSTAHNEPQVMMTLGAEGWIPKKPADSPTPATSETVVQRDAPINDEPKNTPDVVDHNRNKRGVKSPSDSAVTGVCCDVVSNSDYNGCYLDGTCGTDAFKEKGVYSYVNQLCLHYYVWPVCAKEANPSSHWPLPLGNKCICNGVNLHEIWESHYCHNNSINFSPPQGLLVQLDDIHKLTPLPSPATSDELSSCVKTFFYEFKGENHPVKIPAGRLFTISSGCNYIKFLEHAVSYYRKQSPWNEYLWDDDKKKWIKTTRPASQNPTTTKLQNSTSTTTALKNSQSISVREIIAFSMGSCPPLVVIGVILCYLKKQRTQASNELSRTCSISSTERNQQNEVQNHSALSDDAVQSTENGCDENEAEDSQNQPLIDKSSNDSLNTSQKADIAASQKEDVLTQDESSSVNTITDHAQDVNTNASNILDTDDSDRIISSAGRNSDDFDTQFDEPTKTKKRQSFLCCFSTPSDSLDNISENCVLKKISKFKPSYEEKVQPDDSNLENYENTEFQRVLQIAGSATTQPSVNAITNDPQHVNTNTSNILDENDSVSSISAASSWGSDDFDTQFDEANDSNLENYENTVFHRSPPIAGSAPTQPLQDDSGNTGTQQNDDSNLENYENTGFHSARPISGSAPTQPLQDDSGNTDIQQNDDNFPDQDCYESFSFNQGVPTLKPVLQPKPESEPGLKSKQKPKKPLKPKLQR